MVEPTSPVRGKGDDYDDAASLEEEEQVVLTDLRGRSLGIFGPQNWIRVGCANVLKWKATEPLILVGILLSTIVMTIQSSPNVNEHPRPTANQGYFNTWEDWALFVLFICFSIEILLRIIVMGLVFNPPDPNGTTQTRSRWKSSPVPPPPTSTMADAALGRSTGTATGSGYPPAASDTLGFSTLRQADSTTALVDRRAHFHTPSSGDSTPPTSSTNKQKPSALGLGLAVGSGGVGLSAALPSTTSSALKHTPFVLSVQQQRAKQHRQRAFLRNSWNRLDAVAVVCFWVSFGLSLYGAEARYNLYTFRALSVLRATRLLTITEGTTTILHSLKKAAPQLVKVALFVAFAMVMFGIIGVQSFKGSYRRVCMWIDPQGIENITMSQMCGGFVNASGKPVGFVVSSTGQSSTEGPKGFICPAPSLCVEQENPNNGAYNFDNIFGSIMQVVIVASANTWTPIMYNMMDADYFVSSLYFIVCLICLNYWLINMFVAVITNTFGSIRDDTKHSAFASTTIGPTIDVLKDALANRPRMSQAPTFFRKMYNATRLFWVAVIVADIGVQASRSNDMTESQLDLLKQLELYFTLAFDVEIVIRAIAALPDWRTLWEKENFADISLAFLTSVIQIPVIRDSPAYGWLTAFQIMRFYRVILAIPRMRRLLVRVLGTFIGLVNMILFMLLMTFLAALISVQLFRGLIVDPSGGDAMTYYQIFNSFLATYQILSSENWTTPLESVLDNMSGQFQIIIASIFLCGWMLFAYFIMINMFIAVINENFAIAEELKMQQQVEAFVKRSEPSAVEETWIRRFNPYHYLTPRPKAVSVENMPSNLVLPMKKAVVQEYMSTEMRDEKTPRVSSARTPTGRVFDALRRKDTRESHPLADMTSPTEENPYAGELLPVVESTTHDDTMGIISERRAQQADFITAHPSYDRSLWIFSQKNPLRRFCQRLVEPAYGGERIKGRPAVKSEKLIFQGLLLAAIIGSIAIAGIATPLYRRNYFLENGQVRWTWFNVTEISLGLVFILEFLIKVIADGFIFAPNAYLLSIWNALDFFVLVTLVVNVVTALVSPDGISRFSRALKALRALRLIGLSPQIRNTFYNVLIVGAGRILDASILAVLYIIPFAVWGLNIFCGALYSCNDSSVNNKAECAGEFFANATFIDSTVTTDWSYLTPRVWANPTVWTFDNFRGSLLILFEIISLEGWINVMESVMTINGIDQQPQPNSQQFNALFFVAYNLIGAVFILTLFVSVIIENFTRRSGSLLLTTEQRQWIDLRKLILHQRPAKRPKVVPRSPFRKWCFDRANAKKGWWARSMTVLYCLHTIVLMTQAASNSNNADQIRNYVFLGFTLIFLLDVMVRLIGLGWNSFIQNGWNVFDIVVVVGTLATTIPILFKISNQSAIQLQKLFLVSIAFKLVQKNDALNELFKTAAASLPAIANIFALWLVLFLVWAIFYVEVFGLTRWVNNETHNQNYSSFWRAMVMLVLASTGEGWNNVMHDYTIESPRCTASPNYLLSDCGSSGWSFALFISWNVLSMYLITNLILGAVIENFSFVFQIYGKVQTINREQMRGYKKVWQQFDPNRTGYMKKKDIVSFLGKLSGIFEVKIYRTEWQLPALWAATIEGPTDGSPSTFAPSRKFPHGRTVDLPRLHRCLDAVDYAEVTRRKHVYNRLYHEAMIEAEASSKGISFRSMLLLLAHYCLVHDDNALQLEEALARREKLEKVMDRVNAENVRGLFKTIVHRRKFLAYRERMRQETTGVPEIVVDSEPPRMSREGLHIDLSTLATPPGSPQGSRFNLTPGSVGSDDDDYFDRSVGSISVGSPTAQRQSISAEDGERVVNEVSAHCQTILSG
ncbi:hypothetical protein T439DRAFT_283840 [Meredithblackwellia eburnea MCA 4105]